MLFRSYDGMGYREPSTGQNGAATNFQRETKDHLIPNQFAKQHRNDRKPTSDSGTHNLSNYWVLSPESFPAAHFAVFPQEIPLRAILLGTSEKGCCGAMVKKLKVREDLTQEERLKVEAFLSSKGWL